MPARGAYINVDVSTCLPPTYYHLLPATCLPAYLPAACLPPACHLPAGGWTRDGDLAPEKMQVEFEVEVDKDWNSLPVC